MVFNLIPVIQGNLNGDQRYVTESQMKALADYMAKNFKKICWNYIILDIGWNYGEGLNTRNFGMKNPPQLMDDKLFAEEMLNY